MAPSTDAEAKRIRIATVPDQWRGVHGARGARGRCNRASSLECLGFFADRKAWLEGSFATAAGGINFPIDRNAQLGIWPSATPRIHRLIANRTIFRLSPLTPNVAMPYTLFDSRTLVR